MTADFEKHLHALEEAVGAGDERAILSAFSDFIAAYPNDAAVHAWGRVFPEASSYSLRVLAYAIAKAATQPSDYLWGPLAAFVSSPIDDAATLTNVASALQLYEGHDEILAAVLAPHFEAFASRCLAAGPLASDAVCDLLIHLNERGVLPQMMSRAQAERVLAKLVEAPEPFNDLGTVRVALKAPTSDVVLAPAGVLEKQLDLLQSTAALSSDLKVAIQSVLLDTLASYEARDQARVFQAVVEEIHLDGPDASEGRLGIETFEKLIHSWKSTIRESVASIAPAVAEGMSTFALVPVAGSFVIRFLLQSSQRSVLEQSFSAVSRLVKNPAELLSDTTLTPETRAQVFTFLDVLAQKELNAVMSFIDADKFTSQRQPIRARTLSPQLVRLRQRKRQSTDGSREVTGILDAANHRVGTFEIIADDSEQIKGDVLAAQRILLLQKVIGRRYKFGLKETITTGTPGRDERRTVLTSVSSIDGVALSEPEVFQVKSGPLQTGDVPQQDRLDRIVEVVRVIASSEELVPERLHMEDTASSRRHLDYMKHGAKVLELLAEDGSLTGAGLSLAHLPDSRVLDLLSVQFELSVVGRSWKEWASAKDLRELDPETAIQFLKERGLPKSMAERRGRTLRRWLKELGSKTADGTENV